MTKEYMNLHKQSSCRIIDNKAVCACGQEMVLVQTKAAEKIYQCQTCYKKLSKMA